MALPTTGACETMSVFGAVISMLYDSSTTPATLKEGGISNSTNNIYTDTSDTPELGRVTSGDRAGAAFVTIVFLAVGVAPILWAAI